jgi:hypothetical protein
MGPSMWDYVFSPRAMMVDAVAGLVVFVLFRLLRPSRPPSKLEWGAIVLITLVVQHWYSGGPSAHAMPTGYVGRMVQACTQEKSQETCLCAVDSLRERIGEPAVVRVAVRAEANSELPKEFLEALAECRQ